MCLVTVPLFPCGSSRAVVMCVASSEADAEERLEEAAAGVRAAVDVVKQVKSAARDHEHYTPVLGYKAFSEVRDLKNERDRTSREVETLVPR